jgi:hypothetical protein
MVIELTVDELLRILEQIKRQTPRPRYKPYKVLIDTHKPRNGHKRF